MAEPTPLQLRAAQLRETHLRDQFGALLMTLAQVMAERDTLGEQASQLIADHAKQLAELEAAITEERAAHALVAQTEGT